MTYDIRDKFIFIKIFIKKWVSRALTLVFFIFVFQFYNMSFGFAEEISWKSCTKYASNPVYHEKLNFYSYRLKDVVKRYGCDAIPVYLAFGDDGGLILGMAESDASFMQSVIGILKGKDALLAMLVNKPKLTAALGSWLTDEEHKQDFMDFLKGLNMEQIEALKDDNPAIAALALLIPNISPKSIARNFSSQEAAVLLNLVELCAVPAAVTAELGLPQLSPYFTTNPNDAINIYKDVIRAWGATSLSHMMQTTPGAASSIIPPLELAELRNTSFIQYSSQEFEKMQKEYILIMRDIYQEAKRLYSAAWAEEICMAFSDSLSLALLKATPEQARKIRQFLLELIRNGKLFRQLFIASGCNDQSNLALLGQAITKAGLLANTEGRDVAPLTALAEWYTDGQLAQRVEEWLKFTNSKNLSLSLESYLNDAPRPETVADAAFIENLVRVSLFRSSLNNQKPFIDDLWIMLNAINRNFKPIPYHPGNALSFINEIKKPLFKILQPGKYQNPRQVMEHLVAYGFPESKDPSLFEHYLADEPIGRMPNVENALDERGRLPESQLLSHGRVFADSAGGYEPDELIDYADYTITVGGAIFAAVGTAGAAAPAVGVAVARVGAKQAAKQLAKRALRQAGKRAIRLGTSLKSVILRPGTAIKKAITVAKTSLKRPSKLPGKAMDVYDKVSTPIDRIRVAKNLFLALGAGALVGSQLGSEDNAFAQESICPQAKTQEDEN